MVPGEQLWCHLRGPFRHRPDPPPPPRRQNPGCAPVLCSVFDVVEDVFTDLKGENPVCHSLDPSYIYIHFCFIRKWHTFSVLREKRPAITLTSERRKSVSTRNTHRGSLGHLRLWFFHRGIENPRLKLSPSVADLAAPASPISPAFACSPSPGPRGRALFHPPRPACSTPVHRSDDIGPPTDTLPHPAILCGRNPPPLPSRPDGRVLTPRADSQSYYGCIDFRSLVHLV